MRALDSGDGVTLLGMAASGPDMTSARAIAAKAIVRYADPLAWAVVAATQAASAPHEWRLTNSADATALLHVAESGPDETMRLVHQAAASGVASPLRFPAAAPSAPAGLACLAFGFRGPSLCLPMPLESGASVALRLAAGWLARGSADLCVVVISTRLHQGPVAAAALLAPASGRLVAPLPDILRALCALPSSSLVMFHDR